MPEDVFFESGGVRCAAGFYHPDSDDDLVPCVVMGHGGSGTKRLGLPKYAERFAAAAWRFWRSTTAVSAPVRANPGR